MLNGLKIDEIHYFIQTEIGWEETDSKTAEGSQDSIYVKELPAAIATCKVTKK